VARIGTRKHPAILRVQAASRAAELVEFCNDRGIVCIVGVEPGEPEDITDLERVLYPTEPIRAAARPGRNDPCPCGSRVKTKKCCPEHSA
jgi:SWIM/SEC-C metal-binding protein